MVVEESALVVEVQEGDDCTCSIDLNQVLFVLFVLLALSLSSLSWLLWCAVVVVYVVVVVFVVVAVAVAMFVVIGRNLSHLLQAACSFSKQVVSSRNSSQCVVNRHVRCNFL
eukprot:392220-Amphidinium_carterae.2